jgi:hypothetical protein
MPSPTRRRPPGGPGLTLAGPAPSLNSASSAAPATYRPPVSPSEPDGEPAEFASVVAALLATGDRRHEVLIREAGRPTRLAPHGLALAATLERDDDELAAGRLVVLHDPDGQPAWDGTFRIACYARAAIDPEMITDPMLPGVTWSWLEEALAERGAEFVALAGTVTTTASARFGQLREDSDTCEVELRCSWSPRWDPEDAESVGSHLEALCDLMIMMAGEPPPDDVVSLSSRSR